MVSLIGNQNASDDSELYKRNLTALKSQPVGCTYKQYVKQRLVVYEQRIDSKANEEEGGFRLHWYGDYQFWVALKRVI